VQKGLSSFHSFLYTLNYATFYLIKPTQHCKV
jgi:hypothetical protein